MNTLKRTLTAVLAAAAVVTPIAMIAAPAHAQSAAWSPVQIERVQWKGGQEYVKLRNTGKINAVNIGGWSLRTQNNQVRYTFAPGFVLPPGRAVFVKTAPAPVPVDVPGSWTAEHETFAAGFNLWKNHHGEVRLRKQFGGTADTCAWGSGPTFNKWC